MTFIDAKEAQAKAGEVVKELMRADEIAVLRAVADRIVGNAHPEEDGRLDIAYAIARYLGLDWPAAQQPETRPVLSEPNRICTADGANVWCNGQIVATAHGFTLRSYRAARIAECLNACAGIDDPAALVQAVRDAIDWIVDYVPDDVGGRGFTLANLRRTLGGAAEARGVVDEAYPTPRNREEAVALARLALAYLGVIDAHIDVAIAHCETDHDTQQQEPKPCKHDFRRDEDHGGACCQLCGEVRQ